LNKPEQKKIERARIMSTTINTEDVAQTVGKANGEEPAQEAKVSKPRKVSATQGPILATEIYSSIVKRGRPQGAKDGYKRVRRTAVQVAEARASTEGDKKPKARAKKRKEEARTAA
jgi:hypothetical protein